MHGDYLLAIRRKQDQVSIRLSSPSSRQMRCLLSDAEELEAQSLAKVRLLTPFVAG